MARRSNCVVAVIIAVVMVFSGLHPTLAQAQVSTAAMQSGESTSTISTRTSEQSHSVDLRSKSRFCKAINKAHRNGIARNKKAANRYYRSGHRRPVVKKRLFLRNIKRDRDHDGVLCGRSRPMPVPSAPDPNGGLEPAITSPPTDVAPCRLQRLRGDVAEGFPLASNRAPSLGAVRAAFIFVDFSDAPAQQSTSQALSMMYPGSRDQFNQLSYGNFNLVADPTASWLRMPNTLASYASNGGIRDHIGYIRDSIALADPVFDFSYTDIVVVVAPPTQQLIFTSPASLWVGAHADGRTLNFATTMFGDGYTDNGWGAGRKSWNVTHEIGHLLGLPDLYAFTGDNGLFPYTGIYDVMGSIWDPTSAPEMFAWHRWSLGWTGDSQIQCWPGKSGITDLTTVSNAAGTKAVIMPLSTTTAIIAEARSATGLDAPTTKPGVLIYKVDTSLGTGEGTIQVLQRPQSTAHEFRDAPLTTGEYLDVDGIRISVEKPVINGFRITTRNL